MNGKLVWIMQSHNTGSSLFMLFQKFVPQTELLHKTGLCPPHTFVNSFPEEQTDMTHIHWRSLIDSGQKGYANSPLSLSLSL